MRPWILLAALACGGEATKGGDSAEPATSSGSTAAGAPGGASTGTGGTGTGTAGTGTGTASTGTDTGTGTGGSGVDPASIAWSLETNTGNPLSATATLTSPEPTTLRIAYGPAGGALLYSTPSVVVAPGEETALHVLGLYPGDWEAAVVVGAAEGPRESVTTRPPPGYRPTTVTPGDGAVFDPHESICASLEEPPAYVCTDREGRPNLYIALPLNAMFVRPLDDGTFLAHPDDEPSLLSHFDVVGNPLGSIGLRDLTGATFEHDWIDEHEVIQITKGAWAGAWAVLTAIVDRTPDGNAVGAGIIVFEPDTGAVLWDWSAHGAPGDRMSIDEDKLPYRRRGFIDYEDDWLHANAFVHDIDADGNEHFWMSLRHQDWIIRIDAPSGEIRSRFGYQGDFVLVDDLDAPAPAELPPAEFAYHQHAPEVRRLADGRLEMLVMDNGNVRADVDGGELPGASYSRAVRFVLDEDSMRATVDFAYGATSGPDRWYSPAAGDADRMPDGESVMFVRAVGDAFIREVDSDGEVVWNQSVPEEGELYRAEFFPSLYETTWTYDAGW